MSYDRTMARLLLQSRLEGALEQNGRARAKAMARAIADYVDKALGVESPARDPDDVDMGR